MRARDLGVCPATVYTLADGYCGGKNGGRACAFVAGCFGSKTISEIPKDPSKSCLACCFYKTLRVQEGADFFSLSFIKHIMAKSEAIPKPLWSELLQRAS